MHLADPVLGSEVSLNVELRVIRASVEDGRRVMYSGEELLTR